MTSTKLPLLAEQVTLRKRVVETARVRVSKRTRSREQQVDMALRRDDVVIERVAVNRLIDGPVYGPIDGIASRQEGDVTIVPIYEEVLVKRLLLKEELHIRRRARIEPREPVSVALRYETVEVVRTPLAQATSPTLEPEHRK